MKAKSLLISFAVVCPAALAVRIFQLFKMINPKNGFIFEDYSTIDNIIKVVFLAVILFFVISARLSRDIDRFTLPQKSLPVAIGLFVASFGFVADTVRFYGNIVENPVIYGVADYILDGVYIVTAIFFMFMGVCVMSGHKIPALTGIIPLGCMLFRLILSYTRFNGLALLSENVLDILAMCFGMLFVHYYARVIGGSLPKKSGRWLYGSGLAFAVISILCTIPRWGIWLAGRTDLLASSHDAEFINIGLAVFAVILLISYASNPSTENEKKAVVPSGRSAFRQVENDTSDPAKSAMLENIDRIYNEISDEKNDLDN